MHELVEWEDLDIFFDEFGIDVTLAITHTDGEATEDIRGIFETPYLKRDFGAFVVDADAPSLTCKWIERFEDVRKGDWIEIGSSDVSDRWYIDSAPQNDGTGVVSFILTHATTQDDEGDMLDDTIDEEPPTGGLFSPNPAGS